jgi:hypothetical protein
LEAGAKLEVKREDCCWMADLLSPSNSLEAEKDFCFCWVEAERLRPSNSLEDGVKLEVKGEDCCWMADLL